MSIDTEAEEQVFISFALLAALWFAQREEGEGKAKRFVRMQIVQMIKTELLTLSYR